MKAIFFNGDEHQDWKRLEQTMPWLQTIYASGEEEKSLANKYHISKHQRPSYVIVDDEGNEFIRGRGSVPAEYLTRLIHENKGR
ncbi:MAG: hypothetical protein ACOCXQ_02655 [Patescibacteria group bacterium]